MKKRKKVLALLLCAVFALIPLTGCSENEDPTQEPTVSVTPEGYYTLREKTVGEVNISERFLYNVIHLSGGKATWTEITGTGTETSEGTYSINGNIVSIKIGLRTYDFETDENYSKLEYTGKIDRKNVTMKYDKNGTFAFGTDSGEINFTDELFGDDITKDFYNYCPSVMIEGRTMHIWYCTNQTSGNVTDYIAYRKGTLHDDGKWTFTEKQIVLSAGESGQWDARHVCDPTVVKGAFRLGDTTYNYLMAYLGCLTSDCTKNEVGIAVAQNPEGPWVKVDNANPIADFYADYSLSRTESNTENAANASWGYGQPSLISLDQQGRILLFYTAGTTSGTYTMVELWDLSDLDHPVKERNLMVSNKGICNVSGASDVINNADFAYDSQTGRLYCIKEDFPYPNSDGIDWITASNTVFYVEIGTIEELETRLFKDYDYTWTMVGKIDSATTGYARNHNCAIVTDAYGYITDPLKLSLVYTMSMLPADYPGWGSGGQWPALHTYRLHGAVMDISI